MSEAEENLDQYYCAACETNPAELEDRIEKLDAALATAEGLRDSHHVAHIDALGRAMAAEAERDFFDGERIKVVERLEAAEARIAKALEILTEPGQWSIWADRARKALRGE